MNRIRLVDHKIILDGFDKLGREVTFAFYPNGVAIFFERKDSKDKNYYIEANIQNNEIVNNSKLYDELKSRIDGGKDIFILTSDSYLQVV